MKKSAVITVPNPKLYEKTSKVSSFDNTLQKQIKEMVKTLRIEGGIGIAANQLGYPNQVLAIEFKESDKKTAKKKAEIPLTIFLNPEIVEYGKTAECFEEGCLSVPKIELEVERPGQIKVKYQNEKGKKIKAAPKGLLARVLQHEIDHLNGLVFTERAKAQFFQKFPEFKDYKIAFFGSGEFAATILEGLILLGFNLEIFTEKSKPAGRDQQLKSTPVAEVARKFGEKYIELEQINIESSFDLLICADFGQKIPKSILEKAKIAALNIHPSLLPKYLGPTPIQTAILNRTKTTGVSIIKMTDKIDEGPIYSQIETEILKNDTYPLLRDRLATLGLKLLIKTLPKIASEEIGLIPNDISQATRTRKFSRNDGKVDWSKKPEEIEAQIRALWPWPGTYTFIDDKRLIIHSAHLKKGKLVLDLVQFEGKKPTKFRDFLRGFKAEKPEWLGKISLTSD